MDPTARGDLVAAKVREWYEENRETFLERHAIPLLSGTPDRAGVHADEFMLALVAAVHRAESEIPR